MADTVNRRELFDQRVAWLAVELAEVLEHEHELSPRTREGLLAVCADAAGVLERRKLELASRDPSRSAE